MKSSSFDTALRMTQAGSLGVKRINGLRRALPSGRPHLPPKDMEILRRRSAVADLHIVFRAQLQEAFDAGAGVLGALPLIAMRKQQDKTRRLTPLGLRARKGTDR